jgi:hypothetical protein
LNARKPGAAVLPWLLNRISFGAAIIAVSVMVHLGFIGAIVFAERRGLPPSQLKSIDVDLVKPEDIEPKKPDVPKQEAPKAPAMAEAKPESAKQQQQKAELPNTKSARAAPAPGSMTAEPEASPADETPASPDIAPGGPPSDVKSKLTPEEIAVLRAQIQKCWKLPVGIPGIIGLEVVIRVGFGAKGQLAGEPVLLQAPAHERGPLLVGIAMTALKECYPFRLPAAKYADWKTLDLKFTATGLSGIAPPPRNLPKKS